MDAYASEYRYANVTISAAVTTNGEGSYAGTMDLTGPFQQLRNMLCEGAFVKQVNAGEANWALLLAACGRQALAHAACGRQTLAHTACGAPSPG